MATHKDNPLFNIPSFWQLNAYRIAPEAVEGVRHKEESGWAIEVVNNSPLPDGNPLDVGFERFDDLWNQLIRNNKYVLPLNNTQGECINYGLFEEVNIVVTLPPEMLCDGEWDESVTLILAEGDEVRWDGTMIV